MIGEGMHIAFEAARWIESHSVMGLWDGDGTVDPDVDSDNRPFVLITADEKMMEKITASIPEKILVGDREVAVIVRPMSLRLS